MLKQKASAQWTEELECPCCEKKVEVEFWADGLVMEWNEAHPYGATVAYEPMSEVDDLELGSIPVDFLSCMSEFEQERIEEKAIELLFENARKEG